MLQLTQTTSSGVTVTDAIHKVINAQLDSEGRASFQMGVYVNSTIKSPVEVRGYGFDSNPAGGDLFAQCYAYALTLPEYAGATTV